MTADLQYLLWATSLTGTTGTDDTKPTLVIELTVAALCLLAIVALAVMS